MPRCKADDITSDKAYLKGTSLTKDEDNAAGGAFFIIPPELSG
jgi:hypothetical protein